MSCEGRRFPMSTVVIPRAKQDGGGVGVMVVCDDGSTWWLNEESKWEAGEPIPGSRYDLEETTQP